MKKRIFNNWTLKLVSVVCAMLLWFVVYNSDDPVDYGRFYSVPVVFENTEVLEKEGKVYQVLDNTDVISSIVVKANRSVIDDLSKDDIRVVADFNNYKMDGTIELDFSSERHSDGEITFNPSSDVLKLFVENRVNKNFRISLETAGEPEEGYIVNSKSTTRNQVSISGGESIINKIDKVVAVVDVADATSDISTSVELVLYDQDGVEIPTENLDMSMKSVDATVVIHPTKIVPVRYEISGEVAENYVTTGEVIYDVTEVAISGRASILATVSEVVVKGEKISIEGAEGDVVLDIDLDEYLMTGISRVDKATNNGHTTVTVKVVPIIEKEFTVLAKQVTISNVPENHFADRTLDTEEFTLTVRGAQHLIEELDEKDLRGKIDFEAWMEENNYTELGIGTVYKISPEFDLGEDFEVISVGTIDVAAGIVEEE